MFPAARLTDLSVTGDPITAPGVPNVLIEKLPAACVGDLVVGPVITGSIVMGSSTVMIGKRPAARVTSQVTGVNTVTGVPLTTAIAKGALTVKIGK